MRAPAAAVSAAACLALLAAAGCTASCADPTPPLALLPAPAPGAPAARPDLLPKPYLDALSELQDRLPSFPSEIAFEVRGGRCCCEAWLCGGACGTCLLTVNAHAHRTRAWRLALPNPCPRRRRRPPAARSSRRSWGAR